MPAANGPLPVPYLSDDDFTTGQDAWQKMIQAGNSDTITQAFTMSSGGGTVRVGGLSFPAASITQLLSAVAVRFVQVRFILLPPALEKFAVVLCAADNDGTPLTAYYGPGTPTPAPVLATAGAVAPGLVGLSIPATLAGTWIVNWQHITPLTQPAFMSANQPLNGYNLSVETFVQALFATGNAPSLQLLLGAHQYYGPGYTGTPTTRFGTIVAALASSLTDMLPGEDVFLDMGLPSPPY